MNEPIDHHYVPIFYLSRWEGADGCICRFSRPYGDEVKAKRVVPKGTAFEERLYETRGLPPDKAQTMEKDFMAKLDDAAAASLVILEKDFNSSGLTDEARNNWSQFLVAQMLRSPGDISQLKSSVEQEWGKETQEIRAEYDAKKIPNAPSTFDEYLNQQNPAHADEFALGIARNLMAHTKICQLINSWHWCVLDIPQEFFPLLTSDQPIWMTATFTEDDASIVMPIGPRKFFAATAKPETQRRLQFNPRRELVKNVNRITVQHARKYVYGIDDNMLPFVQKHMATKRHSTWLERLASMRGHEIVAPDSPSFKK